MIRSVRVENQKQLLKRTYRLAVSHQSWLITHKSLFLIVLAELKRDLVNFNFYMIFRSFDPLKPLYVLNHSLMIFNDQ